MKDSIREILARELRALRTELTAQEVAEAEAEAVKVRGRLLRIRINELEESLADDPA